MKRLAVLGSTGSIGTSTLDVVRRRADSLAVHALVAGRNTALLTEQIREFRPQVAVVATPGDLSNLTDRLQDTGLPRRDWPELASGPMARVEAAIAPEVDFVMSAIVGVEGLAATYAAVEQKKRIGLANKETLVASGSLVMEAAARQGTEMIPVDSEHNGAHQCLRAGDRREVSRLILTASGGPFRKTPAAALEDVTPDQALAHPTWKMGPRITIDSATMMNKGFEVIEACWLFGFAPQEVDVVIHPQSSVHAMVEYNDGSVVAQISTTDMRMPIQYALTYPQRASAPVPRMDWRQARSWEFEPPDEAKFPCLRLAYQAMETGGSAGCTLNAADEVAVEAFLAGRIKYTQIAVLIEETLSRVPVRRPGSVEEVLEIDRESRTMARRLVTEGVRARPVVTA
ncbi:MAG: 1-deoxy-D-xylulose-5-phosphate reductoisomerase [Bryobacteraceae bacterium]|nr:1-deoxy-D-xylulose-5-phosphate reductoisomerase [Bryobacteraceae bacterium]